MRKRGPAKEQGGESDSLSVLKLFTFVSSFPVFSFMLSALPVAISSPPSWTFTTRWTIGMSVCLFVLGLRFFVLEVSFFVWGLSSPFVPTRKRGKKERKKEIKATYLSPRC
jgi:ABC-type Na+ efflux pump permease subunit